MTPVFSFYRILIVALWGILALGLWTPIWVINLKKERKEGRKENIYFLLSRQEFWDFERWKNHHWLQSKPQSWWTSSAQDGLSYSISFQSNHNCCVVWIKIAPIINREILAVKNKREWKHGSHLKVHFLLSIKDMEGTSSDKRQI